MISIIPNFATKNMHYKNNKIIKVKGIAAHSVGTPQPSPEVFVRIWDDPYSKYPTQMVIGAEKAYEVLPCMQTKGKAVFCWHVGSANSYMIGAEITEPSTIKYIGGSSWIDLNPEKTKAHVLATYKNAVEVFAQACLFHELDPLKDGVILSHSECHKRGIGTNHGDVEHIWNKFGLTMKQFRKDIKTCMDSMADSAIDILVKKGIINSPDYWETAQHNLKYLPDLIEKIADKATSNNTDKFNSVKDAIKHLAECGVIDTPEYWLENYYDIRFLDSLLIKSANHIDKNNDFMVRVTIDNLNMRIGPSTSYNRIGYIPKGTYTIVEVNGDWGRLKAKQDYNGKSVNAWIHLDYATRVGV